MCPRRAARSSRASAGLLGASPRGPRFRSFLVLGAGILIGAGILLWESSAESRSVTEEDRKGADREIVPKALSRSYIRQLVSEVNINRLWTSFLRPMLIERQPGSAGNRLVRELITGHLRSLSSGWTVDLDLFDAPTPRGSLSFGSVVATLDPSARRRVVVACHLDSKIFPKDRKGRAFVGATDSAVPCSLILEAVTALDTRLKELKNRGSSLTLQLFFLDGEEAVADWTETDSLYGARHLAQRLEKTELPGGGGNQLDAIGLFVLLDLLGAANPLIVNHFSGTRGHFLRLRDLEKRLHGFDLLQSHPLENSYFRGDLYYGAVEDDHIPFIRRGVPALHVISTPFPAVWHTHDDTEENLHRPTIINLCKILVAFLSETLSL
ncbi:glutaminyl-peptide cyclotransferase-like protein [Spea bombifrons]|uniref:glutaminyl-peptide cyclotransferase-like protein n=1 Tax=Spea bombifrons TaxID=233779 RepID=UPI00234980DD|nr:glutaminyl-peptide cyclotransferase-like protein [Spea bombifrons]